MKVNREIRAPRVRVISQDGEQVGILPLHEALARADDAGLDLVEISPAATPPVCKIMNFGKFRYDQTKREKESKKSQHQVKVKEIKLKPNIDSHDLETKLRHALNFIEDGDKVKVTCTFRGREMAHQDIGYKLMEKVSTTLEDCATPESPAKMMGRTLTVVYAPGGKKKKESTKQSKPGEIESAKNENA